MRQKTPRPLSSPQSGDFVRVERISEFDIYLRTRQDTTRITFSPERADIFGCGCGEERACQLECAIIQLVATPRRIPDERSARPRQPQHSGSSAQTSAAAWLGLWKPQANLDSSVIVLKGGLFRWQDHLSFMAFQRLKNVFGAKHLLGYTTPISRQMSCRHSPFTTRCVFLSSTNHGEFSSEFP